MIEIPRNLFSGSLHHLEAGKILLERVDFKGKKVMDLGCGSGDFSYFFSKLGAAEITGIDINKKAIERAKKKAENWKIENAEFLIMNAHNLDFQDNSFDIIFSNMAFHHFADKERVLLEAKRVLKKNGKILISSPCKGHKNIFQQIKKQLMKEEPFSKYKEQPAKSEKLTEDKMIKLIEKADFSSFYVWSEEISYTEENIDSLMKKYADCVFNLTPHLPEELNKKAWDAIRERVLEHFSGKPLKVVWKMVYVEAEK